LAGSTGLESAYAEAPAGSRRSIPDQQKACEGGPAASGVTVLRLYILII